MKKEEEMLMERDDIKLKWVWKTIRGEKMKPWDVAEQERKRKVNVYSCQQFRFVAADNIEVLKEKMETCDSTKCVECSSSKGPLFVCPRCSLTWYCSTLCFASHWRKCHNNECYI